ncbi:50S ribosomal protein HLP, mitochondrial-like protein [Tanacetum coccineum]
MPRSQQETSCDSFLAQQIRTFIQMRSNLKVVENSGAKRVMCIQALKGKKGARLGDTIVASVKEAQPGGKVKKGQVVYGVVVRAAMQKGRCDGSEVKFDDNVVVLVNKQVFANLIVLTLAALQPLKGGLMAKEFVVITLKCVRSQVQFLLGANNLEWPRQPPEKGGLYLV